LFALVPWWAFALVLSIVILVSRRAPWMLAMIWVSLGVIHELGYWREASETLVLVLTASGLSMLLGVPIGIAAAHSKMLHRIMSPILDAMQTMPTFVYLIPTLMLFGLGMIPGLVSTIVFAVPAAIRVTHHGISQVPISLIEAADAFGASVWQRLWKVELPYAATSIQLAFSQCVMLSLSMVVIAALVGGGGLGAPVVRALNTVNMQQGFSAGLCIVLMAVMLDRLLCSKRGTLA
jgi:glycine betaine/proline transport system permease protein